MQAIKHIVRIPKNHEIRIKIPDHVPVNESVEVIIFLREKPGEHDKKIDQLRAAMKDEVFLDDLKQIAGDFENVDLQDWPE